MSFLLQILKKVCFFRRRCNVLPRNEFQQNHRRLLQNVTSRDEKVEKNIFHQRTSAGDNQISAGKTSPTSPKKTWRKIFSWKLMGKKSIKITCLVVLDVFFTILSLSLVFISFKQILTKCQKTSIYWKIPTISIAVAGKWLCRMPHLQKAWFWHRQKFKKKQFGVENSENPMPFPVNKFFWGVGWGELPNSCFQWIFWLASPIYKPWSSAIWKGSNPTLSLGDETDHHGYFHHLHPPKLTNVLFLRGLFQ